MIYLILTLLIAFPGTVIIFFISLRIKRNGGQTKLKKGKKYSFGGLIGLILVVLGAYWNSQSHVNQFDLGEKFQITLHSKEEESFLDWPIQFNIHIFDEEKNEEYSYRFFSPGGPLLDFYTADSKPNVILVRMYEWHKGVEWIIDLDKNELKQNHGKKLYSFFEKRIRLNSNFEIEEYHLFSHVDMLRKILSQ